MKSDCDLGKNILSGGSEEPVIGVMASVAAVPAGEGVTRDFRIDAIVLNAGVFVLALERDSSSFPGVGCGDLAGMVVLL